MANSTINLATLDFDTNKQSLKTYLQSQDRFADYDFEGSNMSVLLDILTYNTYLNAFYLNMAVNEMFNDTAQIRDSIVSKAKELNYTPRSKKSSKAYLNLTFAQSGLESFTIPEKTRFSGQNSNNTYTFVTKDSVVAYPTNNQFVFANLEIYEGRIINETYITDTSIENQRYVINNDGVDIDSIQITVSEDNGSTNSEFTKASNLFGLNSNSQVYFIQGAENNKYEILFGDNIFGKKPLNNSIIYLTYRINNGDLGNNCKSFSLVDNLGSYNGHGSAIIPSITVVENSFGGAERENIESIRFNSPRHFQTQERAITYNDYISLVKSNFSYIKSVNVFGGEDVTNSVEYGKVFVSPITYSGNYLTNSEKNEIQNFLKSRSAIGISPTVLDFESLEIIINAIVRYDASETNLSATNIKTLIESGIIQYNSDYLQDFNLVFDSSDFQNYIDEIHSSILSNEVVYQIKKKMNVVIDQPSYISVNFDNELKAGTFLSSNFSANGRVYYYTDYNPENNTFTVEQTKNKTSVINTTNKIYLCDTTVVGQKTYVEGGVIDYETGSIELNQITIHDYLNESSLIFYATPQKQNFIAKKNNILTIDIQNGINVEVKAE